MISGVISYDITTDKYRNKLSKILSGYGVRIQYSVFEFNLEDEIYTKMLDKIEKFYKSYIKYVYSKGNIDEIQRSIRIYILCVNCQKKMIIFDKKSKTEKMGMII